jgi:ankyrin repeat protein
MPGVRLFHIMSDDWETTELHMAAYNCDLEWLHERIAAGDDVNQKDSKGFAPLHWCALRGLVGDNQHRVAQALLEAGANQNEVTAGGESALTWAVESGNILLIAALLDGGADVNQVANTTPLMVAARNGYEEVAELLIRRGADVRQKVGSFTAADYANTYGHDRLSDMLNASSR